MTSTDIYCTYLTIYLGNKLPIFYIGSSTIQRISNGYRGSVMSKEFKDMWKYELKSNPHLFKTKVLTIHETRNSALKREHEFHTTLKVVQNPLYINKTIAIINGTYRDNMKGENHPNFGKPQSEQWKQKNREANLGRISPNKGKKLGKRTIEQNKKRSELFIGHIISSETKTKIGMTNGTPVIINGVPYFSKNEAGRQLNMTKRQINRLLSTFL